MRLVVIEWLDHTSEGGSWDDIETAKKCKLTTVLTAGWIIHEDKERVVIAATVTSERMVTDHMAVHRPSIVKIHPLKWKNNQDRARLSRHLFSADLSA